MIPSPNGQNLDRTLLVPPHVGPNVLPNSPFFSKLLRHARRNRLAVRDVDLGLEKTYTDILSDALSLGAVIQQSLSPPVLKALEDGEEVYIGILAAGGYEFTVAVVAILAIGAALVPISVSAPVSEASYVVIRSRQVLLLVSEDAIQLGESIQQNLRSASTPLPLLSILPNLPKKSQYTAFDMIISSTQHLSETAPGVVIFTSGTTGRPKGAVMRRSYTHETALAIGEGYDITHVDVLLHILPVHHTTGLQTSFLVFLVAGACIEFKRGSFDPAWVWNRWLQGGLTIFSAVPTILLRLKWHYEQHISPLATIERAKYDSAANQFHQIICGSSALQDPVQDFWTTLRNHRPILTRYGATEFPGCLKVPTNPPPDLPRGCVGMPVPGVEVKISSGSTGELLVRSPHMFSKYLFDDAATRDAHDAEGFFKTGDILRREGNYFFVVGRESVDIVKSGGYKISTPEIERACLDLPYVQEIAIAGVDDEEFGQRVGAILRTKSDVTTISLERLRGDLRKELAPYKLPTLLKVVEGELPKGGTGKVQKKMLGRDIFPGDWRQKGDVQSWDGKRKGRAKL